MSQGHTTAVELEETRIRQAYARRSARGPESWFNPSYVFMIQQRERRVLPLLAQHGFEHLHDTRILEIGCGTGQWLRDFVKWGAKPDHVMGMDLLPERIAQARQTCPAEVTLTCGSATSLPWPDGSFDLVLQSTVFTSILDAQVQHLVAREMLRVLRPGGVVLWYDYHVNNPWNADVKGVKRSDIARLFPDCRADLHRITLAPPLIRAVIPITRAGCDLLERIPFLCTHYLGVLRKPAAASPPAI